MGVSKNRKDHKKKSRQRTEQLKTVQRKQKQHMLEKYLEIQRQMMQNTQKTGEAVENTEIDVETLEMLDVIDGMGSDDVIINDEFIIDSEDVVEEIPSVEEK